MTKKIMTNDELANLLALPRKTQGWNFREYPPQRAMLTSQCELIVIPAWLWRGRPKMQPNNTAQVMLLRKAG